MNYKLLSAIGLFWNEQNIEVLIWFTVIVNPLFWFFFSVSSPFRFFSFKNIHRIFVFRNLQSSSPIKGFHPKMFTEILVSLEIYRDLILKRYCWKTKGWHQNPKKQFVPQMEGRCSLISDDLLLPELTISSINDHSGVTILSFLFCARITNRHVSKCSARARNKLKRAEKCPFNEQNMGLIIFKIIIN